MSDYLTTEFRTQLTITMDSILRRTMFEIMKIFENSLHDHQIELVHKGEEIAQLKIELQRAEIKLKESECGGDRGAETNKTQINETPREPEDVLPASGQTSNVPEIDFEVPDDWCAPLGCETVTKQDDSGCPSVRLRRLSIPLWHIPIIKQEVVNRDIKSHKRTKGGRRSKRGSTLNKRHKHTQERSSATSDQRTRCPPLRSNMKELLHDIKHGDSDLIGGTGHRRSRRNLTGKEQENTLKSKTEEIKITSTEPASTEQKMVEDDGEKKYSCKFCNKVFDTEFGRSVHVRSHKRCRGCKKEFPFPSALKCHKPFCGKLKNLLAKEAQSTVPPKPQSSSSRHGEPSVQEDGSTKRYSCVHCNKKFHSHCRFKEHMRVHTGEKPFPCSMCPKKFRINQSLKLHMIRMHKDQVNSSGTNRDLALTKHLEVIEDNREDLISSSKDTNQAINHENVKRERNPGRHERPGWQTMGTRCNNGFTCLSCKKFVRNKYLLIEHFRTHTGEKPIKCDGCSAKFRSRGQLCVHKKKCCSPLIECEKCEKKFSLQARYNKHLTNCHKEWPYLCKVCGKGFFTEGRRRNHMERCHL